MGSNNVQYSYEEVYEIFKQKGFKLLSKEYVNNKQNLDCEDEYGYKYHINLVNMVRSSGNYVKFSTYNPYTIQNIHRYIVDKNIECNLLSDEWISNNSNLKFRCKCGEEFETTWSTFYSRGKYTCRNCSAKRRSDSDRLSYEDVKRYLLENGLDIVDKSYHNNSTRIKVKCSCGEEFEDTFSNIKNRKRFKCPKCKYTEETRKILNKEKVKFFKGESFYPCDYCNKDNMGCNPINNRCHIYEYFKREHKYLKDGWTPLEYIAVIDNVVGKKIDTLDDLVERLNSKTIEDIIDLLDTNLKIGGKIPLQVNVTCCVCGKTIQRKKSEGIRDYPLCGNKCRKNLIPMLISNGVMPHTLTMPHLTISELLGELNISHINEHIIKYHSIDIYINLNNMIEVMGDYWHGNPTKYVSKYELDDIQRKDIKQDKSKNTYIKKYLGADILYLWEKDITENTELCKMLILEYIANNGKLQDYHSYNYHIENNKLVINDVVIKPYFK